MTISLYYFNIRGFGEYIRLLLIDQGVSFEDYQYERFSEEWEKLKKTMIFGQAPCLKDGNEEFVQTGAIMRYLARKYDLYGSNPADAAFIDMVFECVRDLRAKYERYIYYSDETKENYDSVTLPETLANLSKLLKHCSQFVSGDKISFADYVLFEELDVANTTAPGSLNKFENLKQLHANMSARPNLKQYVLTRTTRINGIDRQ
ncbi:unnamed protein product [Caenorhabditis angaria]|uniref:glutathione transferase n=1 Tax=Caenorhabditis angaria TaxID=860376 RepID=A0A9P1IX08_9PELO|nr:unnamed protein product [Caenorhabditis angaria]